jgi:hypothetical protein
MQVRLYEIFKFVQLILNLNHFIKNPRFDCENFIGLLLLSVP